MSLENLYFFLSGHEGYLYLFISSCNLMASSLLFSAKSSPFDANIIPREELMIIPAFWEFNPALTVFSTSPPCAPMPGTKKVISPDNFLISASSSGYVAPTTSRQLLFVFQELTTFLQTYL